LILQRLYNKGYIPQPVHSLEHSKQGCAAANYSMMMSTLKPTGAMKGTKSRVDLSRSRVYFFRNAKNVYRQSERFITTQINASSEIERQEALTVDQLREEVKARTAAMSNLELQLQRLETLRNEELTAAMDRFKDLERALAEAEASLDTEAARVADLEARIMELEADLENAAASADVLREKLYGAQSAEKEAREVAHKAEQDAEAARSLAASELVACEAMVKKAEELSTAVERRLKEVEMAIDIREDEDSLGAQLEGGDHDTHGGEEEDSIPEAKIRLSEEDAEALLDELDMLRGELAAEMQESEAAAIQVEQLKEQLAALAVLGEDGASVLNGVGKTMASELSAARASAARALAEAEGLRAQIATLEEQLEAARAREQGKAGGKGELALALARIRELEETVAQRESTVAEGRSFLENILKQHLDANGEERLQNVAPSGEKDGSDAKSR
jgi:chromosome segregation ATPase